MASPSDSSPLSLDLEADPEISGDPVLKQISETGLTAEILLKVDTMPAVCTTQMADTMLMANSGPMADIGSGLESENLRWN